MREPWTRLWTDLHLAVTGLLTPRPTPAHPLLGRKRFSLTSWVWAKPTITKTRTSHGSMYGYGGRAFFTQTGTIPVTRGTGGLVSYSGQRTASTSQHAYPKAVSFTALPTTPQPPREYAFEFAVSRYMMQTPYHVAHRVMEEARKESTLQVNPAPHLLPQPSSLDEPYPAAVPNCIMLSGNSAIDVVVVKFLWAPGFPSAWDDWDQVGWLLREAFEAYQWGDTKYYGWARDYYLPARPIPAHVPPRPKVGEETFWTNEAIIGFRTWSVTLDGRLHGVITEWASKWMDAECLATSLSHDAKAAGETPMVHVAPEWGCHCGIYAWKTPLSMSRDIHGLPADFAAGAVALSGDLTGVDGEGGVIEHGEGWRAQKATILALWSWDPNTAGAIINSYPGQFPVRVVEGWPRSGTEALVREMEEWRESVNQSDI